MWLANISLQSMIQISKFQKWAESLKNARAQISKILETDICRMNCCLFKCAGLEIRICRQKTPEMCFCCLLASSYVFPLFLFVEMEAPTSGWQLQPWVSGLCMDQTLGALLIPQTEVLTSLP